MNKKKMILGIEDYAKIDEAYMKIRTLITDSGMTVYNAVGMLEMIKLEILFEASEHEDEDGEI